MIKFNNVIDGGINVMKVFGGVIFTYSAYKGLDVLYDKYNENNEIKQMKVTVEEQTRYENRYNTKFSEDQLKMLKYKEQKVLMEVESMGLKNNVIEMQNNSKKD